ncbi:GlxA family transcriptional regulator [Shimia thalassica]|uniref:GlxA family transcriptional regulator n=2 Tax=Shimia thalassica TaxID=1715693 RepID=UPI0020905337|nr:GlxA family transcriptional regulator [Shimia thalassica]MDO6503744.1 GlxA family transcriptional regulator [Shimia thalassica]
MSSLAPFDFALYEAKLMNIAKNIFQPNQAPLETAVLVLDDCNTLSFAAAVDPMRATNRRAGKNLFRWKFFTPTGAPAQLTSGLSINGAPIAQAEGFDLLVMVAGFNLEAHATPRLLSSLRRLHAAGVAIAAIDGGPWILARAGLLDGHSATTHWEDLEDLATRFPQVDARRDRFVISPPFATSGGAAPGIDMMLHLISTRFGQGLARRVASAFLYDPVPLGTQRQSISATSRKIRRNPQIARALDLMEAHLDTPLSIAEIAKRMSLSQRSLENRFRTHLNLSPHAYYLQLRLDEAYRLATDTSQSVQDIALATGFASQASFARAFKAGFGQSVRLLRRAQDA